MIAGLLVATAGTAPLAAAAAGSGGGDISAGGPAAATYVAVEDLPRGATSDTPHAYTTTGLSDPSPQSVYQHNRYGNFTYTIPGLTAGGSYTVRLHFAEEYWTTAGSRTFNVLINGTQVLTDFDIFAAAGGEYIAVIEPFTATASSTGTITIQFVTVKDNAQVNGIEIVPSGGTGANTVSVTGPGNQTGTAGTAASLQVSGSDSASEQTLTYTATRLPAGLSINSGTGLITGTPTTAGTAAVTVTATDTTGATGSATFTWTVNASGSGPGGVDISAGGPAAAPFAADEDFAGGATSDTTHAITTTGLSDPAPQSVYQHNRYGNFTYTIPGLTAGASYTVRLHFAEEYWTTAGSRTFNVLINGTQVLTDFDIFATAGGEYIAVIEPFTATASSTGTITIQFVTVKDNAQVNGIEIVPSGGTGANTVSVTGPGNQTGTAGTAASLQVSGSDSASGQTLTYTATRLPAGLSINFQRFENFVPTQFKELATDDAPYGIPSPGDDPAFQAGGAYANYFTSYAAANGDTTDSTAQIFGCGGTLAANPTLCAALNRHVAQLPASEQSNPANFYQAAPANYYAEFWHENAINGKQYGFR